MTTLNLILFCIFIFNSLCVCSNVIFDYDSFKSNLISFKDNLNSRFCPVSLKYYQLNRAIRNNDVDSLKKYLLENDSYCSALNLNFDTIFKANNQNLFSEISKSPCFQKEETIGSLLRSASQHKSSVSSKTNAFIYEISFNFFVFKRECEKLLPHEYIPIKNLLLLNPLLSYEGSNILHVAVKNTDELLYQCAPKDTKYLHIADSSNRLPSDLITNENGLNLVYKRLIIEYSFGKFDNCKSDSLVFPPKLLLSFAPKAKNFSPNNDIIESLISHVQSCCRYPLNTGELFYLYALKSDLEILEELLHENPLLKYQDMTILHLAIKLNDAKLYKLIPKNEKYIHLINLKEYLTSFVSHDLLLERLAFEFLPSESEPTSHSYPSHSRIDVDARYRSLIDFAFNQINVNEPLVDYLIDFSIYLNTKDETYNYINEICLKCIERSLSSCITKILKDFPFVKTLSDSSNVLQLATKPNEFATTLDLPKNHLVEPEVILPILSIALKEKHEQISNQVLETSQLINVDMDMSNKNHERCSRCFKEMVSSRAYDMANKMLESHPSLIEQGMGQTLLHALAINDDINMIPLLKNNVDYVFILDDNRRPAASYAKSSQVKQFILERFVFEYQGNVEKLLPYRSRISKSFKNIFSFVTNHKLFSYKLRDSKLVRDALTILKEFDEKFGSNFLGEIFIAQIKSKSYDNIQDILWVKPLVSYNRKNILHFAAILNDIKLFELVPTEKIYYLHLLDNRNASPISYIQSYEMFNRFSDRLRFYEFKSEFKDKIKKEMNEKKQTWMFF